MAKPDWTAIVLAGGRSSRFGTDKLSARLHGCRLIDLVIDGIPTEIPIIVVGPDPAPIRRPVEVVREEPPFGGPVAAIEAGLRKVATARVGIIAADMPGAAPYLEELVCDLPGDADGLIPVDESGRMQVLCGAYRTTSLQAAIARIGTTGTSGLAMQQVTTGLRMHAVPWPLGRTWDVDTPADLLLGEHILAIEPENGIDDEDREAGNGEG